MKNKSLKKKHYYTLSNEVENIWCKPCIYCDNEIKIGEYHDIHTFIPKFYSYSTHQKCSNEFIKNLK